jgi:flagellar basal-body rod protein FlgF/flagellar basal-body rod protein FlgG
MLSRFENAAAAMNAIQRNQERVSNNLANANTTGYKRDRFFTEAFNERLDAQGAPRSDRRVRQANDMSAGALKDTGNPLDVALGGDDSS